jgi:hypothetical protein
MSISHFLLQNEWIKPYVAILSDMSLPSNERLNCLCRIVIEASNRAERKRDKQWEELLMSRLKKASYNEDKEKEYAVRSSFRGEAIAYDSLLQHLRKNTYSISCEEELSGKGHVNGRENCLICNPQ